MRELLKGKKRNIHTIEMVFLLFLLFILFYRVQSMVQENYLDVPLGVLLHQHVPWVGVAVDVAKSKNVEREK